MTDQPKTKVLVIDDEIDMRIFLSTLLKTNGFIPVAARNGKEGVQKAEEHDFDLILMDVMMPEQGGVLTYSRIKSEDALKDIPVIMLSAVEKETFFYSLKMLDAQTGTIIPDPDAYVVKPPDPRYLLKIIRDLSGRHSD